MDYEPLTDAEWTLVGDIFSSTPQDVRGRSRVDARPCANAVLHVLTVKCGWKGGGLPKNLGYPSAPTVYRRYIEWTDNGTLERAVKELRKSGRSFSLARIDENPSVARKTAVVPRFFNGTETLEAMHAAARARLIEGKPANWKCEADHAYA